jgi:1,4-dihydroxy-2-naphthoyl-CoA hydrolase
MVDINIDSSIKDKFSELESKFRGSFIDILGIEFVTVSQELVTAECEIKQHHLQPFGYLHGGVNVSIAESLASVGAYLNIDVSTKSAVGQEINANHLKSIHEGVIFAECKALHIGKRSQVWETKIKDKKKGGLLTISRCTIAIL